MAVAVVPHWRKMPVAISSETIIANGVGAPIGMEPLPFMETRQPVRTAGQPDVARPQIEIPVVDDTDVFNTIPDVGVWKLYYWRYDYNGLRRCNDNRRRNRRRYHDGSRQTEPKADANSGVGGQARRANQGGNKK